MPRDHGVRDVETQRDISRGLARVKPLQRFAAPMRRQFRLAAEHDVVSPGLRALVAALQDKRALELGYTANDGYQEAAVRRRGVGPDIGRQIERG